MLVEADYDYPKTIPFQTDSTITLASDDVITFRAGVPGPIDGEIEDPLVEQALTRTDSRSASGTIPRTALRFDPGDYSYHVEIERLGIVARGIFRLCKSVGRS